MVRGTSAYYFYHFTVRARFEAISAAPACIMYCVLDCETALGIFLDSEHERAPRLVTASETQCSSSVLDRCVENMYTLLSWVIGEISHRPRLLCVFSSVWFMRYSSRQPESVGKIQIRQCSGVGKVSEVRLSM
jgi:hypothetical protein